MRIKLEKPLTLKESLLKKEALAVEQKLEKKVKIKAKNKLAPLTEQESRIIEQDTKQELSIRKQVRTPRRKIIGTPSNLPKIDTWPLDEKEQNDHENEPLVDITPENIPVEPEVFEFTEPELDVYAEGNEYPTPDEEREQLEMIDQHNLETFGTKDQSKIGMILAEKYLKHEVSLETLPPNLDFPVDNFDEYNNQIQKTSTQRDAQIHGNPNSYEFRKPRREKNRGHDYGNGTREGQRQGFLNKIKNFWLELKADTKSIAEELGWDEEAELEKQRKQYLEGLRRESTNPPHGTVDGKFGPMTKASDQDHKPSA